jgi:uncharacterized membrane-anchored protein
MRSLKEFLALATFVSFVFFSVPYGLAEEDNSSLLWKTGPSEVNLGDQATLRLPEGYRFIGAQDTQRILRKMGNFPSGSELGLVMATEPNDHWFVVIQYISAGYVKDDDAAKWDADAMLAAIKEGTAEDNKKRQTQGTPILTVRGWEEKPSYDTAVNKVTWAISLAEGHNVGVNYYTLALGRYGYMSMNMVGPLDELATLKPHVSTLLSNLNFNEGKRYADFNGATDKVAAVGLSALIAGAAFKSGLLAKLGAFLFPILIAAKKLIVFLLIAAGALARKLFKKEEPAPQV